MCTVSCCCFSASFRPKDEEREIKPGQQKILPWTSLAKPATLPHNNGGLQPCSLTHTHAATARLSIRPCARMRQVYEVAARRAVCHAATASCRLRIGKVCEGVARLRRLLRPLRARTRAQGCGEHASIITRGICFQRDIVPKLNCA